VVGENLFTRESGAVANQFHIPAAIEPYSSDLVSAPRRIVLGKKSGLSSIKLKLEELGLEVAEDRHAPLLASVKEQGTAAGRLLTDDEFRNLVQGV
jgi:isopropylmalate/homocitrate/citramalate synthase